MTYAAEAAESGLDVGQWKIDDIKGSVEGEPWSIRGLLLDSFKN